jgi:threonine dehydrogenase-like Zn-dependent dehydrogenase
MRDRPSTGAPRIYRGKLDDPELYRTFSDKRDGCVKVVMNPATA